MGGGFFDNTFDPYSGAYAYPRAQRRARQPQRATARAPGVRSEVPLRKETVRTIPVVDGSDVAAVAARKGEREEAVDLAPVLSSTDAASAAKKIQAVYRGYSVRKTQPLKHLRVIKKVREELEVLKRRLEEPEQKKKLRSDAQERLRWTEGVMALLLRLDSLQGVLPEVRLLRKAVTKELLQLQEMVDSMSVGLEVAAAESGEEGSGSPGVEVTTFEKHVPQVQSDMHDQVVDSHAGESAPFPESIGEEVGFVLEPVSEEADLKVILDVEKEQILTTVSVTEEVEVEPASSQIELPPIESNDDEHVRVENTAETGESASASPASLENMWRRDEVGRLTEEAERQDMCHNGGNDVSDSSFDPSSAHFEEKETTSGCRENQEDGRMTPADCRWYEDGIDDLQGSQPSPADDSNNALSDRALMLQLLEENRKLNDVVKRVLHWGKHQNDVIHNLTARIKQLEEDESRLNLLKDEESMDRKTNENDVSLQRYGKPQLGNYIDSEDWPSAGSDDSF